MTRPLSLLVTIWLSGIIQFAHADHHHPLLLKEDFESGMRRWTTTDVKKPFWQIEKQQDAETPNHYLRVTGTSDYKPPHRSPHSIALLKDFLVSDFVLTADFQSTNVNAGNHRDLCLFWGYQDPAHFYYVHFGAKADPHACQIFIVNNAPRTKITVDEAPGTPWTTGWHKVKIIRRVEDGSIEVYFDDMDKPFMTAKDKNFTWGQVGLGTFDDNGNFDNVQLHGVRVEKPGS